MTGQAGVIELAHATLLNTMASWWFWPVIAAVSVAVLWLALVLGLLTAARRAEARALAGFIPDCLVLTGRLLTDPRVPRRQKLLLTGLVGYLALPFDLVPDFIPVAGQLDDALVVGLVLRRFLQSGGEQLVRQYWPGPDQSLRVVLRVAGDRARGRIGWSCAASD
jgi:uncharacterized membrane protein YkvA (DUF1232 family)